ncbi:MAG: TetR/AcrR family transcriptional regulator [Candidatus Symbiothrix sp.]|jgi:AcrR family transcriptional regulator|nr:TetR/AcrR family transcriptional regulator [Candidatus Symbiothrix sp.]
MPRTKQQYEQIRSEKRQMIREAALQLFASEGYAATSIHEIARAAGISKGLLYNYFDSKEDLLNSIIDNLLEEFGNMIDPDHDGIVTEEEAKGFLDKMFDRIINQKEEFKLYFQMCLQPQVAEYMLQLYYSKKTKIYREQLIYKYFSQKLNLLSPKAAYFTVISFLKGFAMVYVYTDMFSGEFMLQYKEELKKIFFNK